MKYSQQIDELIEYFVVLKALGQQVDTYIQPVHYDIRATANIRKLLLKDYSVDDLWESTLLEFFTMLENSLGDQTFNLYGYCTIYPKNVVYAKESGYCEAGPSNVLTVGMVVSLHKALTRN